MTPDYDRVTALIANAAFKVWDEDPYTRVLRGKADSILWRVANHTGCASELEGKLATIREGLTEAELAKVNNLAGDAMLAAARLRA
jgi:hypothetical protein